MDSDGRQNIVLFRDYGGIGILKVDENYHVLQGAQFKITDFNGRDIPFVANTYSEGTIAISLDGDYFSSYENALAFLPKSIQNALQNIHNSDDIINSPLNFNNHWSGYYGVGMYVPIRIEEVRSPVGYKKINFIKILRVDLSYNTNSNNEITKSTITIEQTPGEPILVDQYEFDENDMNQFTAQYYSDNFGELDTLDRNCGGTIIRGKADFCELYCQGLAYYFINQEGEVNLVVSNTVNGVEKYDATLYKDLEYKIEVKNTGNASSGNNVIVTYVPENVKVVESSIENGVYDAENNTITWNIDYIDAGETIQLGYSAEAPSKIEGSGLIGKTTVKSDQVETKQSENTIVVMTKELAIIQNPNTGEYGIYIPYINRFVSLYILAVMAIIITAIVVYFRNKRSLKRKSL